MAVGVLRTSTFLYLKHSQSRLGVIGRVTSYTKIYTVLLGTLFSVFSFDFDASRVHIFNQASTHTWRPRHIRDNSVPTKKIRRPVPYAQTGRKRGRVSTEASTKQGGATPSPAQEAQPVGETGEARPAALQESRRSSHGRHAGNQ